MDSVCNTCGTAHAGGVQRQTGSGGCKQQHALQPGAVQAKGSLQLLTSDLSKQPAHLHRHIAAPIAALLQDLVEVAWSGNEASSRSESAVNPGSRAAPTCCNRHAIHQLTPALTGSSPSRFSVKKYSTIPESCWSPLHQQRQAGCFEASKAQAAQRQWQQQWRQQWHRSTESSLKSIRGISSGSGCHRQTGKLPFHSSLLLPVQPRDSGQPWQHSPDHQLGDGT